MGHAMPCPDPLMSHSVAPATRSAQGAHRSHPAAACSRHAIVIGASMAGLLATRVLSDHFARVTLVERDALPDAVLPRKGVPQGRHLHVLHTKGEEILNRLFSGLSGDLAASGAARLNMPGDVIWFHLGGYSVRFRSALTSLAMSRPLLESHVRRRVLNLPNVTCRQGCDAVALHPSADRRRVVGIALRPAGGVEESIDADLTVDATGRGSRSPAWLDSLGYRRPTETVVSIGYGYTTRLYRRDAASLPDAEAVFVQPTPPDDRRFGGLFPIEGNRWIVTMGGYRDHHAPADEKGFLEHARELSAPDLYRVLSRAEPVSDFVVHGLPSNLRRHYERIDRFPEGYLIIGDAICSFNPIYGQGMTVSALEAEVLDRMLTRHSAGPGNALARNYFTAVAKTIDNPWMIAAGEDFRYTNVSGRKPLGTDVINWYVSSVHRATHRDRQVTEAFIKVLMSVEAPTTLFHPRIALRVSRSALARSFSR